MATTRTRPTDRCEASVAGRQQNQVGAVVAAKAACAGRAVRSLGGGYGISFGVATGTASRATRGAAPSSEFGHRVAHGVRREAGTGLLVSRHETRGALTTSYTQDCHCTPPCWARRLACSGSATASPEVRGVGIRRARARRLLSAARKSAASRSVFAGPALACMAREMGPPRRGESCAGAFTHAPVAQLVEPVRSIRGADPGSIAWVAGSSPAGRNFPFREVTK